jgi:RES domain
MIACVHCFADLYIQELIRNKSQQISDCTSCRSENVAIVDLTTLEDLSETLFSYYKEESAANGKTFIDCLKQDWNLFPRLDYSDSLKMLKALYPDYDFEGKFYVKENGDEDGGDSWEELKHELIRENRFFPKNQKTLNRLNQIFPTLIFKEKIEIFYRSRISEELLNVSKMGKPPQDRATAGRANPIGIPYLYVASNVETTIAEVRPQKRDKVFIAKFIPKEDLKLLDLRNPVQRISPFELASIEISPKEVHKNINYLVRLGEELSKPINSSRAHIEYIPTQFLCEFVKHSNQNFDGVVYKSSVGDGFNVAIFNDDKLEAQGDTFVHEIESIAYESKKLDLDRI